jgi:hypothetical protein
MAKQNDPNFSKSGVETAIRSGAKPVSKPTRRPMSAKTASASGRWPKRDEAWSAPYPGTAYNPPSPDREPGQATHSDNARAVELLKPDYSGKFFKK